MALRSWASTPVWTTRANMERRFPTLRSRVVRPRVAPSEPVDLEAAIDDYIDDAIVRGQIGLAEVLKANGRTDEDLEGNTAETSGSLRMRTEQAAYVALFEADAGRAMPENVERMRDDLMAWATDLDRGFRLMDRAEGEESDRDNPAVRPTAVPARYSSSLGSEARRLLC
jgi:hypothetical protein